MRSSHEIIFNWIFVTESDPLRGLSPNLAGVPTLPRGKGEFSTNPHHRLSTLSAMFNSSPLHFIKRAYMSLNGWLQRWGKKVTQSSGNPFTTG